MYPYFGTVTKCEDTPVEFPPQYQPQQPGIQSFMIPQPISENPTIEALLGRRYLPIAGDIGYEAFCRQAVEQTLSAFGRVDILINNAAKQHVQNSMEQISSEQPGYASCLIK